MCPKFFLKAEQLDGVNLFSFSDACPRTVIEMMQFALPVVFLSIKYKERGRIC